MPGDRIASTADDDLSPCALPSWVPQTRIIRIPCGEHFDAIRVPTSEAQRAHDALGPASGPVLACDYTQTWHFLLGPHTTDPRSWDVPGTRLLPRGTLLGIPPAFVTHGRDVRWVVAPGLGTTAPASLRATLTGPVALDSPDATTAGQHASLLEQAFPILDDTIFSPRSASELTRLTLTEKRVAEHLVAGRSNAEGASELGMSASSFSGHLSGIGRKFRVASRPARAHAVLASGQVMPPPATATAPDFGAEEQRLLRALAERSGTYAIAAAAGIAAADVRAQISILVAKSNAANDVHLISLAHAWGLLGADPGSTERPQSQPTGAA